MRRAKVINNGMESRIETTTPANSALCASFTRLAKLAARSSKKTAAAAPTRGASARASFHKPGENSGRLRKNSVFANSDRCRAVIAITVCRASICRERARLSVASISSYSLRWSAHSALTPAAAELAAAGSIGFTLGGVAPWVAAEEALASGFAGAALPGICASASLTAGCAGRRARPAREPKRRTSRRATASPVAGAARRSPAAAASDGRSHSAVRAAAARRDRAADATRRRSRSHRPTRSQPRPASLAPDRESCCAFRSRRSRPRRLAR